MKEWTSKEIRELRAKLKISQVVFGTLIGVTRNYVYYLERGVKTPSKTLQLLLDCIENEKGMKKKKEGGRHGTRNL